MNFHSSNFHEPSHRHTLSKNFFVFEHRTDVCKRGKRGCLAETYFPGLWARALKPPAARIILLDY